MKMLQLRTTKGNWTILASSLEEAEKMLKSTPRNFERKSCEPLYIQEVEDGILFVD